MAIETTLKVNGDSTDAQRDQRNLREDLEDTVDAIERIGRESRDMGREVGQGARQAERALESMERQADDTGDATQSITSRVAGFASGILTAEFAMQVLERAVEAVGAALASYIEQNQSAQQAHGALQRSMDRAVQAFQQGAFGDGRAEAAMIALSDSVDIATKSFEDNEGAIATASNAFTGFIIEANRLAEAMDRDSNALNEFLYHVRGLNPAVMLYREFAETGEEAAEAAENAARAVRQVGPPPDRWRVLEFFTDTIEHARNAAQNVQAFRANIQRLTGADIFHLEPDDPEEFVRAGRTRVEREELVLDEIKRSREEKRAQEYQDMLEAQEREVQLMAERKARLDEIAMLRAEQDDERAAMAEEKDMMLHEREIERMEELAQKEEEIQQRRRDAVSAYLGGFDRQVADVLVGSQSLEEGMRAAFGGIASAAADAAMAQAGILLFTPGGQTAAVGLFAAATAARVIASALGYQGAAGGGAGGGGQTVRNTQVSVTVAGEGGNVQTGRAVAESVRDAIERGAA